MIGGAVLRWTVRLIALIPLLPLLAWARLQVDDRPLAGTRIGDVPLLPRRELRPRLEQRAKAWGQGIFTMYAGPYISRRTRAALGASLDVDAAYARASLLGRTGNPLADLGTYAAARHGTLTVTWQPRIERALLAKALVAVQAQVERPPVPGSYGRDGRLIAGIAGQTVNSVFAMARLERALRAGATSAQLAVSAIKPSSPLPYNVASAGAATQLLYGAETHYGEGHELGRSRNIEIAAQTIDGAIIDPGEEFSFNRRVGERNFDRGFQAAKELAKRRVVEGVGGGVCQVAATLHAAAFLGGMDITTYQPHSRPVGYIALGLDTMVSWPDQDLRIRNPYPFPVVIHSRAGDGLVRVELTGASRPHPVEWETRVLERVAAGEEVVVDESTAPGQRRMLQEAIDGLLVERRRTVYWPTGAETTTVKLRYPPTPRLIALGSF